MATEAVYIARLPWSSWPAGIGSSWAPDLGQLKSI
jgi:hypothetical protein